MMFGEIVEPSTRALIWDEEVGELPEYEVKLYQPAGYPEPPSDIENLIFTDSARVRKIMNVKESGVQVKHYAKNWIVFYDGSENLLINELVLAFESWINKARTIHSIATALISSFQPAENVSNNVTFARCLTNNREVPYNFCKKLETPNLIQGLGASVLSYCIHNNIKANLWVIYTDNTSIDSVNSAEIVKILQTLGVKCNIDFKVGSSSSNLYM